MTPRFSTLGCFDVSRFFRYNSCCMCLDVAALLPQVALDMVAGTMVGAASHRAMWHIATLQEEMRTLTGPAPAFSGHFSRLRVLFCGGFRNSINPLFSKALWIYLPLNLFPDHFCVCLVLLCTFCARNAGKGCERSAVFYSMKMPPQYFNWSESDGKCDLGNVLNAKQPGIYFIKVEKRFENYIVISFFPI